jgi:hypothetical protein
MAANSFGQITSRLMKDPSQTVLLLNGKEWTGDRQIFPNDEITCKPLVAPPEAGPAEVSTKAEASAFSVFVKLEGDPMAWTIRKGHEWEDFNQKVKEEFNLENFSASFCGRPWTENSPPPTKDQTITVNPKLRAGAPKRKTVDWPERAVPLDQILFEKFEWTNKAKLSPRQIKANGMVLEVLAEMAKLSTAPVHIGHLLRVLQDETHIPYPSPDTQERKKLRPDMTIRDVLCLLPIHPWPPARPGQCFHPECVKSKADMSKHDHLRSHGMKRDFIESITEERLPTSFYFDGESCLAATTASLLNAMVMAPLSAKFSDAYKVGMGPEKQLNTMADLANTWDQEGRAEWHHQVGDFWGPIFKNQQDGGGWLTIEEIHTTGSEHRFIPKKPAEEEPWKRHRHYELRSDDDPAFVLCEEVCKACSGGDFDNLSLHQLYNVHMVEELIERHRLAQERNHEDQEALDRELDQVLDIDEPLEPVQIAGEVNDWDKEIDQQWQHFAPCIEKSGLNQRVTVEAHVRFQRAQWIQMSKEQRDLYTTWKNQRYANAKPDEIKVRDLIVSPDCSHLPPSHYACPICWLSQTMHKESTAAGMP